MYKKLTKPTARKLFNSGREIIVIRNKCGLDSMFKSRLYRKECEKSIEDMRDEFLFDKLVNSFEYYNHDSELGNYTHFYIKA